MRFVLINISKCIPSNVIDRWNEAALKIPGEESQTRGYKQDQIDNHHIHSGYTQASEHRRSEVRWLRQDTNSELTNEITSRLLEVVNREAEVLACDYYQHLAPIQHTTYYTGCYYKTHIDSFEDPNRLYNRKISISVSLSDESEYTGGKLIVKGKEANMSSKGDISIFLSYMPHEVTPVLSGTRKSLVAWIRGPQWR